jgi:hypothetical protein
MANQAIPNAIGRVAGSRHVRETIAARTARNRYPAIARVSYQCGEDAPVGVGGQADREKEEPRVVEPDKRLRPRVGQTLGAAAGPLRRVHAPHERVDGRGRGERRPRLADGVPRLLARTDGR